MRRLALASIVSAALVALLALPAISSARTGADCSYTNAQAGPVGVTIDPAHSMTPGTSDVAVGGCVDLAGAVQGGGNRFDGGTAEAGVGTNDSATGGPAVYGIVDGDNDNVDPTATDNSKGYIGLSNFETGTPGGDPCDGSNNDTGSGTNAGGCLTIYSAATGPVAALPVPLVTCGNVTSPNRTWEDSGRDGCTIPE
jgi:hypothetical protein